MFKVAVCVTLLENVFCTNECCAMNKKLVMHLATDDNPVLLKKKIYLAVDKSEDESVEERSLCAKVAN